MIQYAILGLLNWRPYSGYDLKKIISESSTFYWSGNNNQIYRSLVQLHEEGCVTAEVQVQESLPAKKVYTITEKGRKALRHWVLSTPELPELRNTFLIQLTWADMLTTEEINSLLQAYEAELDLQLRMQEEKVRRKESAPDRTPRETYLWQQVSKNIRSIYEHELDWVRQTRQGLEAF